MEEANVKYARQVDSNSSAQRNSDAGNKQSSLGEKKVLIVSQNSCTPSLNKVPTLLKAESEQTYIDRDMNFNKEDDERVYTDRMTKEPGSPPHNSSVD